MARRSIVDGKPNRQRLGLALVADVGYRRHYIQSALSLDTDEKRPLRLIGDGLKKIAIVNKVMKPRLDDGGTLTMGLFGFLLSPCGLDPV